MKFINYLSSISGIGIFPMISLFIFVSFFAFVIVYLIKSDKKHINYMKNIPVDKNENN